MTFSAKECREWKKDLAFYVAMAVGEAAGL